MEKAMQVDLNSRYNNAWAEVNTRLHLRQNAITVYVTLMSLVIVGMGLRDKDGGFVAPWLAWFVPIFSVLFSVMVYMHDSIIKNLCKFIRYCEQKDNPEGVIPNYLSSSEFSVHDNQVRVYHHIACAILIFCMNVLALSVFHFTAGPAYPQQEPWVMTVGIAFLLLAIAFVSCTALPSKKKKHKKHTPGNPNPSITAGKKVDDGDSLFLVEDD